MAMRRKVVIVGAGPAGCAAALAAAELGLEVTLVDEHPQAPAAMSLDAPYFYGARLPAVLSNEAEIADRVLGANEALMECLEAGVDVIVGTSVWGVFQPGPNSRHLSGSEIGLADRERSWMLPFNHLVVAAGARDLVLSFPGWELPGVIGVMGASALLSRYAASAAASSSSAPETLHSPSPATLAPPIWRSPGSSDRRPRSRVTRSSRGPLRMTACHSFSARPSSGPSATAR